MYLILLIVISGSLGGLTFALAAKNSYHLTIPVSGKKWGTGIFGHIIIGIAAAFVAIAFSELLGLELEISKAVTIDGRMYVEPIWPAIVRLLGIGIVGGFSGLKVISGLSEKLLSDIQNNVKN